MNKEIEKIGIGRQANDIHGHCGRKPYYFPTPADRSDFRCEQNAPPGWICLFLIDVDPIGLIHGNMLLSGIIGVPVDFKSGQERPAIMFRFRFP